MKNLLLIATLTCLCSNVFAFTVSGNKAAILNKSLLAAGATSTQYSNSSFMILRFVECKRASGVIVSPTVCSFKDLSYNDFLEVSGDRAEAVFKALTKSGVKSKKSSSFEFQEETIVLDGLECINVFYPKHLACEIAD